MTIKYIKVDNVRAHIALQEFATKVADAVKEGFVISHDVKHHARELGFGQFDITMVKPATTGFARVGDILTPQQTELVTSTPEVLFEGGAYHCGPAEVENPFAEELAAPPVAVATATVSPIAAHLETLKSKQDLLDFAVKYGITIPEEVKIPTAIKKYLKEKIANTA